MGSAVSYAKAVHKLFVKVSDLQVHWNWWVFVKSEPKSVKITKDLNYFSLCACNLSSTRFSHFELNY